MVAIPSLSARAKEKNGTAISFHYVCQFIPMYQT